MEYPIVLLPNPERKLISCDVSEHHLVRYTKDKNVIDEAIGLVSDKAIGQPSETHLPDMSASLLGIYKIDHIALALTAVGLELYSNYCEPDINVDPIPVYEKDFVLDENRGFWFVQVLKVHEVKATYQIKEETFEAVCHVHHTPMLWNFWHFSVRWFVLNVNKFWHEMSKEEKKESGWNKILAHETRSIIRTFATIELPEPIEIQPECYTKT